jgi:hypothetical protein
MWPGTWPQPSHQFSLFPSGVNASLRSHVQGVLVYLARMMTGSHGWLQGWCLPSCEPFPPTSPLLLPLRQRGLSLGRQRHHQYYRNLVDLYNTLLSISIPGPSLRTQPLASHLAASCSATRRSCRLRSVDPQSSTLVILSTFKHCGFACIMHASSFSF